MKVLISPPLLLLRLARNLVELMLRCSMNGQLYDLAIWTEVKKKHVTGLDVADRTYSKGHCNHTTERRSCVVLQS